MQLTASRRMISAKIARYAIVLVQIASAAAFSSSAIAANSEAAFQAALNSITAPEVKSHIEYLASEKLEGREAGTLGSREAEKYLTEQYLKFKLRPGGVNGKFEQPFPPNFCNVIAVLPGSDEKLKDEYVVVGAHYDHVGYGNRSNSYEPFSRVHPGADDNASGTSALLEVAQAFSILPEAPRRTMIFISFDAEEKGIFGSQYWARHPTVPAENVVAMLNMDMVGHLRENHVTILGDRTGYGWRRFLSEQNGDSEFTMDFAWTLKPNADHYPFYAAGIPVLMLHTGMHDNYHRPSDTADKINTEGESRVARLCFLAAYKLAEMPERIRYREAAAHETPETEQSLDSLTTPPGPRLGATLDDSAPGEGIRLSRIDRHSAAEKAGLQVDDRVLRCNEEEMRRSDDLIGAIMTSDAPAKLTVLREGEKEPLKISVELEGRPLRLGISWRTDDAEPGVIILTHVVPGAPAAKAGMQVGDRIYRVGGKDFRDENVFMDLVNDLSKDGGSPMTFIVERDGRMKTIHVERRTSSGKKRAA